MRRPDHVRGTPDRLRLREVPAADAEPAAVSVLVPADEPVFVGQGQCGERFSLLGGGGTAQSVCRRMAQQRTGGCPSGGAAGADVLALLELRGRPVRPAAGIACGTTFTRR